VAARFLARGVHKGFVLSQVGLPRSTYHYRPKGGRRGRRPPGYTLKMDASLVTDSCVVEEIRELLSRDFVRYGYHKVTHHLKDRGYVINKKKVYRLMKEEGLLSKKRIRAKGERDFVKWAKVRPDRPYRILETDIKYLHIHGEGRNAYLLTVLDTFSRRALGYRLGKKMRKREVKGLLEEVLESLPGVEGLVVRCDNGGQFIAGMVREYLKGKSITQEFTHVGVPEENAHIEAFHSIIEAEVERAYEFDTFEELKETIGRYFRFYNSERIHSSLGYMSPDDFLQKHYQDKLMQELQEVVLEDSNLLVKI
jgi:transposase InsO family protein